MVLFFKCYSHRRITLAPVWTQKAQRSVPWFRSPVTDRNVTHLHRRGDEAHSDGPSPTDITTLTFVCFLFLLIRPSSNRTIAGRDRIMVYFHAVLSNDFKVDPESDRVFVKAGPPLSKWEDDLVELYFTRY